MTRICPNCEDQELIFQDDSFSHHFGTEIIKYWYCEKCDYQTDEPEDDSDWVYERKKEEYEVDEE